MRSLMRRYAKPLAVALVLLDVSGARAVNVTVPLAGSRTFFTAELGVKGYLAAATKQDWSHKGGPAMTGVQYSARDLDQVGKGGRVYPKPVLPFAGAVLAARESRAGPLQARRLPFDVSPVRSPHLHSRK